MLISAPKETGVKGGRKVVVPTAGISRSSSSATRPRAFMLDVLPWSDAMPVVV